MKRYIKLEPEIERALKKLFRIFKKPQNSVSIFLVDNATMKKLNKESRSKNQVTNVLAFPAPRPIWGSPMSGRKKHQPFDKLRVNIWDIGLRGPCKTLGEIYLAPGYIKKKREDPIFLLIHGFLHLLGFNHIKKSDRIKMQLQEQKLLKQLRTKDKGLRTKLRTGK